MNASLVGWSDSDGRLEAVIDENASIGAARDNALVVRTDGVSGHHARITRQDGKYFVEDAGSRNGTWVNGERVTRARLHHLDVVTLGRFADLVFLERVVSEQRAAAAAARAAEVEAEAPSEMEWRTRLVWSPEELQNLRAAGLNDPAAVAAKPAASAPAPAAKAPAPAAPAPAAKAKPEAAKPAAAAQPVEQSKPAPRSPEPAPSERTQFMPGASFTLPSSITAGGDEPPAGERTQLRPPDSASGAVGRPPAEMLNPSERTQLFRPGMGSDMGLSAPPAELLTPQERTEFRPSGGGSTTSLPVPPAEMFSDERTQLAGAGSSGLVPPPAAAIEADADAPAADSDEPPATALPSGSLLGFRDVGPPSTNAMSAPTVMPTSSPRLDTPQTAAARAASMPIRAVRLTGDFGEFELPIGVSTVGRAAEATIRIDSREMSRIHTKITVTPESVSVEDNGSANGTSVNGATIDSLRRLIDGDRLAFANYEFRVELLRLEGDR